MVSLGQIRESQPDKKKECRERGFSFLHHFVEIHFRSAQQVLQPPLVGSLTRASTPPRRRRRRRQRRRRRATTVPRVRGRLPHIRRRDAIVEGRMNMYIVATITGDPYELRRRRNDFYDPPRET